MSSSYYAGRAAALISMHDKERVIVPALLSVFQSNIIVVRNYNTDVFGTFSREVERLGTQFATARLKAERAMELTGLDIGISSEGSFSAHPLLPFLPWNVEIVLLADKKEDMVVYGEHATGNTNYGQKLVRDISEAKDFAEKAGFPHHWVIVRPEHDRHPDIVKGIDSWSKFFAATKLAFEQSATGLVFIETDMRAHANPTRMEAIAKAAEDLASKLVSFCPRCGAPGFAVVRKLRGLPCEWCGLPTDEVRSSVFACLKCTYEEEQAVASATASAGRCPRCNP
ncbi:MAG: hypothetical protein DDT36_01256 [Firmicutes bacterium]|nr:hypothetical protein [Bacillota bacterium]